MTEERIRVTITVSDEDRAGVAHFLGRHKSGLRGAHQRADWDTVRHHIEATIYGDLDELRGWVDQCDEVPA